MSNTYANLGVGTSWGSWTRREMSRQGLPEAQAERWLIVSGGGCRGAMPATPTSTVSERDLQMRTRWVREARFLVQGHTAQEQGWNSDLLTSQSQEGRQLEYTLKVGVFVATWRAGGQTSCRALGCPKGGQDVWVSLLEGQRRDLWTSIHGRADIVPSEFMGSYNYSE